MFTDTPFQPGQKLAETGKVLSGVIAMAHAVTHENVLISG